MSKRFLGIVSGVSCYTSWGILGVFWALLRVVPAIDVLAYRFIFSLVFMILVLSFQKKWTEFFEVFKELVRSGQLIFICLSTALMSINWGIYIYMVGHGQATEASLGYYIMPLLNVILAVILFKESLSRASVLAILFAGSGVVVFAIQAGSLPLNTLVMAAAFCFYGVIKKKNPLPASFSLTLETIVSVPFAVLYLWFGSTTPFFTLDLSIIFLLVLSGMITAVPLLLFTIAAKNLDFLTLSFIQYVNPTIQLLIAIFWLHEPFDPTKFIVFGLIWMGMLIFTVGSIKSHRNLAMRQKKI